MATDSAELVQIVAEAHDIARNIGREPSTAHLLLATFTVQGQADVLLRERGCDEDAVLAEVAAQGSAPGEEHGLFEQALVRARQLADDCGSAQAEGLHLLVAFIRLSRSAAAQLLERTAAPLASLRTTALGYLTGATPRRRAREEAPPPPVERAAVVQRLPAQARREVEAPVGRREAEARGESEAPLARRELEALGHAGSPLSSGPPGVTTRPPQGAQPASLAASSGPPSTSLPSTSLPSGAGLPLAAAIAHSLPQPAAALSPFALDPRQFPWLTSHGRNLTQLAADGRLDPAIGRAREIDEVLDVLGKRRANNPVLVGEPGVGKTAIVEGLAQRMLDLREDGRILFELDVSGLVAGTQLRGSFSERLLGIKDEVRRAEGRVVVFIDELHMIIGAGAAGEGPQDAANELKAALARGEFPCVGATTHDEFRKHIQGDAALERRFVPILVREPSVRDTLVILEGAAAHYAGHHGVNFLPEALEAAAQLTARHVRDRCLPDKAFAAIDLAGSRARREGRREVSRDDIARAVARMAGVPEERLLQPDGERFLALERRLAGRIIGHEDNLARLSRAVRRNYAGFSAQRPLASFLFCGPSGVGKTETAKALAEELFAGPAGSALVRIDLSEYSEPHTVARLVGAPPGYVGYGEGGQLTEAVRRKPACVVLLDEVEKAHPSVLQLLLQVLDEGQLTDGRGRRIDFSSTVVILTSNLGAQAFGGAGPRAMGFGAGGPPDPSLDKTLPPGPVEHPQAQRALEQARAAFPPELWARLDDRLVFAPLARDEISRIAHLLLADSSRRLQEERRIAFRTGPGLVEHLIARGGYQTALGARPMRQVIQRLVESPLADEILAGRVRSGDKLLACADERGVEFRREAQ